jgi:hypothetical protein
MLYFDVKQLVLMNVACRLQTKVHLPLLGDIAQEAMHVLLPKVLLQVPVCSSWHLWQQAGVPLLQQLEDPARRTQMPLKFFPRL